MNDVYNKIMSITKDFPVIYRKTANGTIYFWSVSVKKDKKTL